MPPDVPLARADAVALRARLAVADDTKIAKILAVVDSASAPAINRALLDPLRPRLAAMKPGRPLRFTRLVFIPLDPLIVPAPAWKPSEPTVPRTALDAMAACVRRALGEEALTIDRAVAGLKSDDARVVTSIGATLWPRAGEILDNAPVPPEWEETGLRQSAWSGLARPVAAVLRRAPRLRALIRDSEIGAIETDDEIVHEILRNTANEPPEGCAMLTRLILEQSPHATALLRRLMTLSSDPAEKAVLREAIATGMDSVLTGMEQTDGVSGEVGQAPVADAAARVRRISALLRDIETDPGFFRHRPRVQGIREQLDTVCRGRFADGMAEGLSMPLNTAAGPIDGGGQIVLEHRARDLRALEKAGRTLGGGPVYDRQLADAADVVLKAAKAGVLTPARRLRLIEILAGAEAAEALYDEDRVRISAAASRAVGSLERPADLRPELSA